MWHSLTSRVGDFERYSSRPPPESVRTDVRSYADVITTRLDGFRYNAINKYGEKHSDRAA